MHTRANILTERDFFWTSPAIAELLPFDSLNFNDFSVLSHIKVTYGWKFIKLILNINNNGKVIHMIFLGLSPVTMELLLFDCLNFK